MTPLGGHSGSPALPALALFLALLALQRGWELKRSDRNQRALRSRGAVEHGRGHFPLIVALHALFPLALGAEVLLAGTRPGPLWPIWLAVLVAAWALRWASMRALGERWTVRVLTLPGVPPLRRGPYRWLRHPSYVAVALELVSASLMFGAWRTAIGISALNLILLGVRIRVEERALLSPPPPPRGQAGAGPGPRPG